jgi:hypothetical protein
MDFKVLLFGLGATFLGYSLWRTGSRASSLIRGTATSKIASGAKGYAEVEGRASATPAGPLRDPITHQPCVWFSVVTEKFSISGKCQWKTVKTARSSRPFVIDDGSGRCLISTAEVHIYEPGENAIIKERWNLRHKVSWIREGEPVFAIGYLQRTTDLTVRTILRGSSLPGPASYPDTRHDEEALVKRATEILRAWKQNPEHLAKFDSNGDGKVDVQEWETARASAREEAAEDLGLRSATGTAVKNGEEAAPVNDITHRLIKPPDGRPFLLSAHGEASLVSNSRSQSILGLVFFVIGVMTVLGFLHSCVGG